MSDRSIQNELLALTTQIVVAHVSKNYVTLSELPQLIREVFHALASVDITDTVDPPHPAVSTKRSIFPDYIICLEDGKKLKMLKRHLKTSYNLSPEEYRERWGLPADYPMVAPDYSKKRSMLAKKIGFGTRNINDV
ncbi:MAG: MucR family transcriptional regulator [Rhodospirillaceae bacterium]|jgi:predicted transcriptional regulator|nr:MucR family transcriptional regulator [Rhodospirillaceae bacterium]